jgi:hypothetical protein
MKNQLIALRATTTGVLVSVLFTFLGGCQSNDQILNYEVDFKHLVRSAFYTQQELLKLHLGADVKLNSQRYRFLIQSYCDLIDRGYIGVSNKPGQKKPEQCMSYSNNLLATQTKLVEKQISANITRRCITLFHRCFNNCSLRNRACKACEQRGIKCLKG